MTKVDIFSGFLGAGKTTLIKKLIKEVYGGEKLVLIENEFGEIGIDGGFLQDAGINITEMNSGCICCSLVGDFGEALRKVMSEFAPDRILIEPSGVGKLSDVIRAVRELNIDGLSLNSAVAVVDAAKCKMYMKNFGEFFNDQIEAANAIVLSRTDGMDEEKLVEITELLRGHNESAAIITTPWEKLGGGQILEAMERKNTLEDELRRLGSEHEHCHEHVSCCCCHEHDHEHHHDHEHRHHHHGHENEHEHEHHHHEHHHADEVFSSLGVETARKYSRAELERILASLDSGAFGEVLRAKGIVETPDGEWLHFDFVPGEADIRGGAAAVTCRLCVIGAGLDEGAVKELFGV